MVHVPRAVQLNQSTGVLDSCQPSLLGGAPSHQSLECCHNGSLGSRSDDRYVLNNLRALLAADEARRSGFSALLSARDSILALLNAIATWTQGLVGLALGGYRIG